MMRRLRAWALRLVGTFDAGRRDGDLADELESHVRLHIDDRVRAGMTPGEARRHAILALGGVEQTKEQFRDQRGMPAFAHLIQDIRYGLRTLRGNPGFAAAAIVTLGLGLGANMAIFRFVDAVLLKSLPVPNPEELVLVRPFAFSYPAFRELAARNADVLASTAARWTIRVNLTADGTTEYLPAELVSGTYFSTLGVRPAIGRLLNPEDDGAEGAHPVCVIGYTLWQRRFGGDPAVLARTVELNAKRVEIVGVTERGFSGADLHARYEVQIPMSMTQVFTGMERDSTGWSWLTILGRLAPGVSREQAQTAVRATFQPKLDWQKRTLLSLADGRQGAGSLKTQLADPVVIAQLLSGCVLVLTTNPERSGYSKERTREFHAEWLRRARRVPGVASVSLASVTAMSGAMFAGAISVPDTKPRSGPAPNNNFNVVTPDYFQTIGLPLVAGRGFSERDEMSGPAVAIVNERFVDYYYPGESPIGRQIKVFRKSVEIVGLVRTAKYQAIREEPQITIYFPAAQRPVEELTLHARVVGSTTAAVPALMETVRAIDPKVPVYRVGVLEDHVNARLANERVLNVLSILFASLAVLVACAGLYALVAYSVVRRTREIGVRLAVGAQRKDILGLFVNDVVALVGIGIALGIPLSLVVGRQFSAVLYGLAPSSLSTLLLASALLASVAAVATGLPAVRATKVDPIGALREQ